MPLMHFKKCTVQKYSKIQQARVMKTQTKGLRKNSELLSRNRTCNPPSWARLNRHQKRPPRSRYFVYDVRDLLVYPTAELYAVRSALHCLSMRTCWHTLSTTIQHPHEQLKWGSSSLLKNSVSSAFIIYGPLLDTAVT